MLTCKHCGKEKEEKEFSVHLGCVSGYDVSKCKACKKSAWDWTKVSYEKRIFHRVTARAKEKGIEFNLELTDIILLEVCPVFNKPFVYGDTDWTYSIDRIDSSKGYIKGNIAIISNRANRAKNDLTRDELQLIIEYMDRNAK